jgi:hypothetical protein
MTVSLECAGVAKELMETSLSVLAVHQTFLGPPIQTEKQ